MPAAIRELRHGEARLFLELHAQSVRGLATFIKNPDHELRLFAELDGTVVGLAALPEDSELRACYVLPEAAALARPGHGIAVASDRKGVWHA